MEQIKRKHPIIDYVAIIFGTTLMAIAINSIFEPMNLVTGGVTGLAIVIKNATGSIMEGGIPIWITNLIINIPLFIIAFLIKGRNFGSRTLLATLSLTFGLYITQTVPVITEDILLATVYGAVISGIGLGLVFSGFATTGGTDLAASIIQHYVRHVSVAKIMMVIDAIIVGVGAYTFGPQKALYAILTIFITTKVIDSFLEGTNFSKAAFIISDNYNEIAEAILQRLDRGVTGLNAVGMYSKNEKQMLLCVVSKKEIIQVKEIIKEIDKKAFVIVADVREVLGEGFIEYNH